MFVETKDSRVKRDIESKALVASNTNDRDRVRSTRALSKRVNTTDERISSLETKVDLILAALTELTKK